ncbi:unnamed protein product, partial [Thelazia callipaeda]|uniref:Acyl_transf_3 domain-containing protein n=1 Tax=Thelazia callipaeda TaxID=103827 RepID=A0A158RBI6_THECL
KVNAIIVIIEDSNYCFKCLLIYSKEVWLANKKDSNDVLGSFVTEFFADSQWQLIIDLDFLKSLFLKFEKALKTGDEQSIQRLLTMLQPLKEYDVSSFCIADIAHYLWTAVEYARFVEKGNHCTNCSCKSELREHESYQWIFNVLDAMGKVPAGILNGNNLWIGSWKIIKLFTGFFIKFLLAFSMYTNGGNILKTEKRDNQIDCLHGTRVLSMFWIILGHSFYYIVTSLTVDNLFPTVIAFPQKFLNLIILQAPLAVDSFFYLSGMLTSFLFMEKFKVEAAKGRSIYSFEMWSSFYIHRYIRITPLYVLVMILDITLLTHFSDGPFWRPIEANYCRKSWWTNLIYMNNFLLQDVEICMGWTWYLANDMQFHLFSPILLILLYTNQVVGIIVSLSLITISSLVHLFIIHANNYPPAPLLTTKLQLVQDLNAYWPDVYIKPYIRCNPYIIGVLIGFALHKFTLRPLFAKWKIIAGWIISTIFGFSSVFSLYYYALTGDISDIARIMYALFGRNAYALSLAWVTFACATGYGGTVNDLLSWRAWIPLSRITFSAYLIHPILLQIYYLSRPHAFHFTTVYQMLYQFAIAVALAYSVGFFLSIAFEVPISILQNIIMDKLIAQIRANRYLKPPEIKVKLAVALSVNAEEILLTETNLDSHENYILDQKHKAMQL